MLADPENLSAEILAALAHPNRIRILECLRKNPRCNRELAPELGLEQSNLSRHLKLLAQAGILVSSKKGLRVNFKVADQRVYRILDFAKAIVKQHVEKKAEVLEREWTLHPSSRS